MTEWFDKRTGRAYCGCPFDDCVHYREAERLSASKGEALIRVYRVTFCGAAVLLLAVILWSLVA